MTARLLPVVLLCVLVVAGCGSSDTNGENGGKAGTTPVATGAENLRADVRRSTEVDAAEFPQVRDGTLQEVADDIGAAGTTVAFATPKVTTGKSRVAFGILDDKQQFIYGPTVIYTARSPGARARGPFPAPADSLITDPPYRSQTAAAEGDPFAAVYEAEVEFDKPGKVPVLIVTEVPGEGRIGATAFIEVIDAGKDPVPGVGEPAPRVKTDTLASVGGDKDLLDTRVPPSDMHEVSFDEVAGKKPVALLFATPQLCQSRVCGPVVDIALQLKKTYGDRVEFIHQEVYVDNDLNKGLRPPLAAFKLQTEPWLFTIDKDGRVAARLEGSFGFRSFEEAIRAAL